MQDSPDFPDSPSEGDIDESNSDVATATTDPKIAEPPRYAVILHNDDYTTMEFVIEVLTQVFRKTEEQALQIMLEVHQKGRGIAGIYSREIAETKVFQVESRAQERQYPLKCSFEPVL